ncbi:MAG: hypothetical protein SGI77_19835 [Pirellulaceae bacterium]|nr:hypothetical protein [Pirellulaceae bacterium]
MPFEIDESNIRQTRVREKPSSSHQFSLKFLLILFTFAVIVAAFLQLSFLSDGLAKSESPKQLFAIAKRGTSERYRG